MVAPKTTLIVDCGSAKVDNLEAIVSSEGWKTKRKHLAEISTSDLQDCLAVIISGGPLLFTDADPIAAAELRNRFVWLKSVELPIFGICLGHQALALQAGAEIQRGPERREADAIQISKPHPLLAGIESGTVFAEDHCEGVTRPDGFQILGTSAHYEVEIMTNDEAKRYGVQFHPEVSGEPGRRLIANFLRLTES
ncbi:MAG: GMP synthase (glutamine-hydrolyzing) [Verrucomicrobiales bacterium]|jgi:GMP synthase (glutamine-hydrolysing)